jgi:hypothetical protein
VFISRASPSQLRIPNLTPSLALVHLVLQSLGSAMVVVFFLHDPDDPFRLTIGTTAAITDATFLILFKRKERQLEVRPVAVGSTAWSTRTCVASSSSCSPCV